MSDEWLVDGLPLPGDWTPAEPCAAPGGANSIVDTITLKGAPATVTSVANDKKLWALVLNDGTPEADFRLDRFDDTGALAGSPMSIVRATGVVTFEDPVMLAGDPVEPLEAATKNYVDSNGLREAPMDGATYGRENGAWAPLPASYLPEAPNTSVRFGRFNSTWQPDAIQTDAPSDGAPYARQNGDWAPALTDAPNDGQYYTRRNAAWAIAPGGMTDAPNDGTAYARKSAGWAHLTHTDIADWTATLAPYALISSVPAPSATAPAMDGTANAGASAAFSRGDHVHPTDTSRYAASNPAGYQTAAQVTATLAPYALTASVPGASSSVPLMDGTAAAGTGATFSRGDHVHPRDTTKANLTGAAFTGPISGTGASFSSAVSAGGGVTSAGSLISTTGNVQSIASGAAPPVYYLLDNTSQIRGTLQWSPSLGVVYLSNPSSPGGNWGQNTSGDITITGANALKVGGGAWAASSDARIKTVKRDYAHGLDAVLGLQPVVFTYNGNDTPTADVDDAPHIVEKATTRVAPFPASRHYNAAIEGREFIGFVAQEAELTLPELVTMADGFIDGEAVTDLRNLDVTPLIYALVNAVKTLAARVEVLEARP
jgi:Chaperone of endosialidase